MEDSVRRRSAGDSAIRRMLKAITEQMAVCLWNFTQRTSVLDTHCSTRAASHGYDLVHQHCRSLFKLEDGEQTCNLLVVLHVLEMTAGRGDRPAGPYWVLFVLPNTIRIRRENLIFDNADPLQPSGHYMYRTGVTICTASLTFTNCSFCPHSVCMCFVWIWEQTAIFFPIQH